MKLKTIAAGIAGLALAGSGANALQITETEALNATSVLTFNLFDSSLGTLNWVRWTVDITSTGGTFELDNDGASPASGNITFGAAAQISDATGGVVLLDNSGFPGAAISPIVTATESDLGINLTADNGNDAFGSVQSDAPGNDYYSFTATSASNSNSQFVNNAWESTYALNGGGTFTVNGTITAISLFSGAGPSLATASLSSTVAGNVTLTYDYTPTSEVPEPGTAIMSLVALGGVGGLIWRKKMRRTA
jgi:hypothetical protein